MTNSILAKNTFPLYRDPEGTRFSGPGLQAVSGRFSQGVFVGAAGNAVIVPSWGSGTPTSASPVIRAFLNTVRGYRATVVYTWYYINSEDGGKKKINFAWNNTLGCYIEDRAEPRFKLVEGVDGNTLIPDETLTIIRDLASPTNITTDQICVEYDVTINNSHESYTSSIDLNFFQTGRGGYGCFVDASRKILSDLPGESESVLTCSVYDEKGDEVTDYSRFIFEWHQGLHGDTNGDGTVDSSVGGDVLARGVNLRQITVGRDDVADYQIFVCCVYPSTVNNFPADDQRLCQGSTTIHDTADIFRVRMVDTDSCHNDGVSKSYGTIIFEKQVADSNGQLIWQQVSPSAVIDGSDSFEWRYSVYMPEVGGNGMFDIIDVASWNDAHPSSNDRIDVDVRSGGRQLYVALPQLLFADYHILNVDAWVVKINS